MRTSQLSGAAKRIASTCSPKRRQVPSPVQVVPKCLASVKLDAEVSGAGTVNYKGNAADVRQHVSGAGTVSKVN